MKEIALGRLRVRIGEATSEYVNGLAPDLPPLAWTLEEFRTLNGLIDEYAYPDPESVARQWADACGLGPPSDTSFGTRTYSGQLGRAEITVWFIADRERFENG